MWQMQDFSFKFQAFVYIKIIFSFSIDISNFMQLSSVLISSIDFDFGKKKKIFKLKMKKKWCNLSSLKLLTLNILKANQFFIKI